MFSESPRAVGDRVGEVGVGNRRGGRERVEAGMDVGLRSHDAKNIHQQPTTFEIILCACRSAGRKDRCVNVGAS